MTKSPHNTPNNAVTPTRGESGSPATQAGGPLRAHQPPQSGQTRHGKTQAELTTILNLDFLPGEYRERRVARKKTVWQIAILLLFGGVVGATAVYQLGLQRAMQNRLEAIAGPYAMAQARKQQLAKLQQKLLSSCQAAQLYVYLRHPWPRTQILRFATQPLPPSVTLEELRVVREAAAHHTQIEPGEGRSGARNGQQQEDALKPGPVRDLEQLRRENDGLVVVVQMTGFTRSTADLHDYLTAVAASPLIQEAELRSIENIGDGQHAGTSRFAVRLAVVPGFGQPDGPEGPLTETCAVDAASTEAEEKPG
jgi:hypothetical protein